MSCIWRISGEALDVDVLLAQYNVRPYRTWKKGDHRPLKGGVYSDSGANFVASDADLDDFESQLDEATEFLEEHAGTIAEIGTGLGVQFSVLDFGVCTREGFVTKYCYFPPQFIQLAANAGVGLEISHYACSEDGAEG